MPAGPRIVFVRFLTGDSPKLTPWIEHSARVVSAPPVATAPRVGAVVWQLVSANNRELARGADVLDTFDEARESALQARDASALLAIEPVSEGARGVYGWYATLENRPVVTCARWYGTDRDRQHSITLALRSISIAELREGSRLTLPSLMGGDRGRIQ